jgi:hypothetical protein
MEDHAEEEYNDEEKESDQDDFEEQSSSSSEEDINSSDEEEVHFDKYTVPKNERKTLPKMSNIEFTRLLETRSNQIEQGSPIGIVTTEKNSIDIAREEILQGKCPLFVVRGGYNKKKEIFHSNELDTSFDVGLQKKEKTPVQLVLDMSIEEIINYKTACPILRKFTEKKE